MHASVPKASYLPSTDSYGSSCPPVISALAETTPVCTLFENTSTSGPWVLIIFSQNDVEHALVVRRPAGPSSVSLLKTACCLEDRQKIKKPFLFLLPEAAPPWTSGGQSKDPLP